MTFVRFATPKDFEKRINENAQRFFSNFAEPEPGFNPKSDISSDEKNIYINVEIPGVKKEDVTVFLENDVLTLSGQKKFTKEENRKSHLNERNYGSFKRTFKFAEKVNPDTASAKFEDGVLRISIEKFAEKPVTERVININ